MFGSYPPVPLQGASRDIYRKAMSNGVQSDSDTVNDLTWTSVKAACLAQPVRVLYPVSGEKDSNGNLPFDKYENFQRGVQEFYSAGGYSDTVQRDVESWKDAQLINLNEQAGYGGGKNETSFNKVQYFRYGLMSFLLPRYKFMLDCVRGGNKGQFSGGGFAPWEYAQWKEFNPLPSKMDSGTQFKSWEEFCQQLLGKDEWQIDLIPSQGACARWMPNLLATADDPNLVTGAEINAFGMKIGDGRVCPSVQYPSSFHLYDKGGYKDGGSNSGYPLYHITMQDGWDNDFYYYSPAPYQMYVVWSSGANGKTMPPWVDLKQLQTKDYNTALDWISDDIKSMGTGK